MSRNTPRSLGLFLSALLALIPLTGCDKEADEAGRVMRPVMSPDFPEPIALVPLPANWKFNTEHPPGEPTVVGPGGVRGYDTPFKAFSFPTDKLMRQVYRQNRQKKRRFSSMEKLIAQDFVPEAKKQGKRLVRTQDLPELAKYDERYNSQLYEAVPTKKRFMAAATEWEDEQKEPSLVVIRVYVGQGSGVQTWSYFSHTPPGVTRGVRKGEGRPLVCPAEHGAQSRFHRLEQSKREAEVG